MYSNPTLTETLANAPTATSGDIITVKITFNDGGNLELKSVLQLGEEWTGASKTADLLNGNILSFDVDGYTMLFPVSSIRFIQIHPALKTPNLLINSSFTMAK